MRRFVFGRYSFAPLLPLALAACGVATSDHESVKTVDQDLSIAASSLTVADVASGYVSGNESFVLPCIKAGTVQQGQSTGTVTVDRTVDKNTVTSSLGLSVGLKARYSMFKADASANFSRSLTDDAYSESFLFYGDYDYGQTVLDSNNWQLNETGQMARDQGTWIETCGDQFVSAVRKGARFYFLMRVDFESKDAKETFDQTANISVNAGALSVEVSDKLTLASTAVGSHAHFHLEAMQLGGVPIKIGSVLGGLGQVTADPNKPTAAEAVLDCSNGQARSCIQVMKNALDYASSTAPGSLQDQLSDPSKLAPIEYTTLPWINLAIQGTPPILSQDLMNQRELLSQKFERLAQSRNRVERIINAGFSLPPAISQKLHDTDTALVASDGLFTTAVGACYENLRYDHNTGQLLPDSVSACTNAVAAIHDINVDPELLDGAASFEIDEKAGQYVLLGVPASGFSTGDPNAMPRDCVASKTADGRGKYCDFTSGSVFWQADYGAHELDGAIMSRYSGAFGALSSRTQGPLGFPTTDVANTPDGQGRFASFEHGAIFYTPRLQTLASYGPIGDYYLSHGSKAANGQLVSGGAPQGPLGYPTSEAAYTSDYLGQYATYANGALLFSSGTGVHQINAGERDYWLGHYNQLGFATTDSYSAPGAQGGGIITQFQKGVLGWHPSYGLKLTQYDLFPRWDQDRASWLGFPLGDEVYSAPDNVHYQQFQGGYVWKNGSDPAIGVKQDIMSAWQRTYGTPFNPGRPQSEEQSKTLNQKATGRMQNFGGGVVLAGPYGAHVVWGALWWNLLLRDPRSSTEYNCGWPTSDNMLASKYFNASPNASPGRYIDNYGSKLDDWYVQTYEQGWMAATLDGQHAWVQCKDRHGRP